MDKVNKIMDELDDMANFTNFGKAVNNKEFIDNPVIAYEKLQQENKELVHYLACMTEQRNKANTTLKEIKAIISGDYEMLDPQALQEIRSIITKAEGRIDE